MPTIVQLNIMPEWDEIFREQGRIFSDPHPYMERIVGIFKKNNVRKVLDLGCGTGRHTVHLAKSGFDVHALDSSPNALAQTEKWLREEGLTARINNKRMEDGLPYPADFFDAVLSVQAIHHNMTAQVLGTINEIGRVLKLGGIVFITVPVLTMGPVPDEMDWHLHQVEPGTYVPERGPEAGVLHHYFTEEELRNAFDGYRIEEFFIDETNHRCLLGTRQE